MGAHGGQRLGCPCVAGRQAPADSHGAGWQAARRAACPHTNSPAPAVPLHLLTPSCHPHANVSPPAAATPSSTWCTTAAPSSASRPAAASSPSSCRCPSPVSPLPPLTPRQRLSVFCGRLGRVCACALCLHCTALLPALPCPDCRHPHISARIHARLSPPPHPTPPPSSSLLALRLPGGPSGPRAEVPGRCAQRKGTQLGVRRHPYARRCAAPPRCVQQQRQPPPHTHTVARRGPGTR